MTRNFGTWERELADRLFTRRDCTLLSALAGVPLSRLDTVCLLDGVDIDDESSLYMLSLAVVGFRAGWEIFPSEAEPRLRGLHRYYQVRNSVGAPWLEAQVKKLLNAGIPVMFTGGLAMRAHYAAEAPRLMFGYDLTVPSAEYERAVVLLRDELRGGAPDDPREQMVNGYTTIHLHKGVPDHRFFSEEPLWDSARSAVFLSCDLLVPGPEDMLLSLLCSPQGAQLAREKNEERDRRLSDCAFVLQMAGADAARLEKRAQACGQTELVRFLLDILRSCAPDLFSGAAWADFFSRSADDEPFLRGMCRLCVETERHDQSPPGLHRTVSFLRAEYKVMERAWRCQGGQGGFLSYVRETRRLRRLPDALRRAGLTGRMRRGE